MAEFFFSDREWLQYRQDGSRTVDAIVLSIAGLNMCTCSKPHLPSAAIAQPAALRLATLVTGVRILSVPFFCFFFIKCLPAYGYG